MFFDRTVFLLISALAFLSNEMLHLGNITCYLFQSRLKYLWSPTPVLALHNLFGIDYLILVECFKHDKHCVSAKN